MTAPRLAKIEIQGFRSFGKARQVFDLPQSISVLWGGNSQGKTSLAEALEFLFTGQIARRELLASAKDEFAEALRNAHLDPAIPVVVEAHILCRDGQVRKLSRTLAADYGRAGATGCASHLQIDGKPCAETDLEAKLGLKLSHPPLRAPVLAQHTLNYVFSASPAERATYFRAILDTQDLEDFRTAVAALQPLLVAPTLPELADLSAVEAIPAIADTVGRILKAKTEADLRKHILTNVSALLKSIGFAPAAALEAQADQIEVELQRRQAQTFPLAMFGHTPLTPWSGPAGTFAGSIDTFLNERAKTDAETQRLVGLFKAALALPDHPADHDPRDCPLCGAVNTFTAERVALIRAKVQATETYTAAATAFLAAIRLVDTQLDALSRSVGQARPQFMSGNGARRRKSGFRVETIKKLVPDTPVVMAWLAGTRHLWRAAQNLDRKIKVARSELSSALSDAEKWDNKTDLDASLEAVVKAQERFEGAVRAYEAPSKALVDPLKAAVDQSTDTKGWEPLIRIARDPPALLKALSAAVAHAAKVKALEKALNEIDAANGKVLDDKFVDLSKEVKKWWDKLRPDEPTFFDAVQRRSDRARRNIDLKVGLAAKDDRSDAKLRDAVAVLSQSQLHCLGLSLFLARAVQENAGFVVLDDPVLTSDDDYRPNFASSVMEGLLDEGLQVIICTQDHASWKDIGHRWEHRGATLFQIVRLDPLLGTEIRSQNDDLAAMIARAQPFVKSQDPLQRKEGAGRLRDAIERFCKIMLVKNRQAKGESLASITDYDGKNFGSYGQNVMSLLIKDPSHPGKLKAAHDYVTPGPHDDKPPSVGELSAAYGDLKKLKRDYLD